MVRALLARNVSPSVNENTEIQEIREGAQAIALEAGELLLEGFRQAPEARVKGEGGDLVTVYDERCEELLRDRLRDLTPGAAIVGEEGGGEAGALSWHVDPIDGTGNFAHGHPWFGIAMGLWTPDQGLVGVVHAPAMGITWAAARGLGATRNGVEMRVSETARLEDGLFATGFPHDRATSPENGYRRFVYVDARTHGVRRCAAASVELAVVADGGYDGFWDHGLSSWDVAASAVLIEEAGGKVTTLDGSPLALSPEVAIMATNGRLHSPLHDALAHAAGLPPIGAVT